MIFTRHHSPILAALATQTARPLGAHAAQRDAPADSSLAAGHETLPSTQAVGLSEDSLGN